MVSLSLLNYSEWLLISALPFFPPVAVRFGRIPKREKQRMLLEMQNAMNSMMSGGQLHHMLRDSSSSSASSSSSSPPSSPQCSQDSETVVAMETSMSSSASSCSSDSGEEDALGSGPAGGTISPSLTERLSNDVADRQRPWNCDSGLTNNGESPCGNSRHVNTGNSAVQQRSSTPSGGRMDNAAHCRYSRQNMNELAESAGNRGHLVSLALSLLVTPVK